MKIICTHEEEKALLAGVARGDENAFRTLFHAYRPGVYAVALKLLSSSSQAEDALQEIFLKIWLNRDRLPEIQHFASYLHTVTRNHLYNVLRRQAYEEVFLRQLAPPDAVAEDVLSPLSLRELREMLQGVLSTLTPQQRKVFELSRLEGLKHEEIAEKLVISRETVKKHIGEALRVVREKMMKYRKAAKYFLFLYPFFLVDVSMMEKHIILWLLTLPG
ncbi:MAG: RNA polymerase sigma-70 factor [Bacteroidetes bacterium]|nr:RNA polymerase sigma-70 factor [Bacteroidota bacterium]